MAAHLTGTDPPVVTVRIAPCLLRLMRVSLTPATLVSGGYKHRLGLDGKSGRQAWHVDTKSIHLYLMPALFHKNKGTRC